MNRSTVSRNALWVQYKKRLLPDTNVVHVGLASETFLSLLHLLISEPFGMIEVESGTIVPLADPFPNLVPDLPGEVRKGFLFSYALYETQKKTSFSQFLEPARGCVCRLSHAVLFLNLSIPVCVPLSGLDDNR